MPKGPAPAREAALDAFAAFCAHNLPAIETSSRHIVRSKRHAAPRRSSGKAEAFLRDAVDGLGLDPRDSALATEIFNGTLRNLISIDHALGGYVRPPKGGLDLGVLCILRLAAYQITRLDKTPSYAVVNDSAGQAKGRHGTGAAGFVNGVLRSMLRGGGRTRPVEGGEVERLSVLHSFPEWLAGRWVRRYGGDAAAELMAYMNTPPALTLRVNTLVTSRDRYAAMLADAGIECGSGAYVPEALRLRSAGDVRGLPGYGEGLFSVQDEAAMLVSHLLAPSKGKAYLDACAAPGGKSTHISELGGGSARVVCADISLDKIRLIIENVGRLGTPGIMPVIASASAPPFGRVFDGALVDAPCTGLGVIRRRPEIRYLRREQDIARMAGTQLGMLNSAADTVVPGGTLVYSTCSTEPGEGEDVVASFLDGRDGFRLEGAAGFLPADARGMVDDGGRMRTLPHRDGVDGFFGARLVRADG